MNLIFQKKKKKEHRKSYYNFQIISDVASVQCPTCKNWFDSDASYQNHLPCGGHEGFDRLKEAQEHIVKDDTGIRPDS